MTTHVFIATAIITFYLSGMETHILIKILRSSARIYLLVNLFTYLLSDWMIFVPQEPSYTTLPDEVRIRTADDELITAVYLEAPNAEYTLLFSHGNAEDLGEVAPFFEQFQAIGYSVLIYDYRGYGTSEGKPSTRNAKKDVEAAYRWLVEEKKVAPKTIIAHGRSLGGGVATWLAARHPVGALIVESSFTSTTRVKTHWKLFFWDKFNSLRSFKKITCPVLVMHGENDETLPIWHGKKLYETAPEPKQYLWIENGRHNNYAYVAGDDYLKTFMSFMELVKEHHSTNVSFKSFNQ
ncbi:MAG TPA: alpha/beta hydrolase [Pontiella sp.]